MKISNLLETSTTTSSIDNMGGAQAPKFGRNPHVLEDETIEETTTSGAISTGASSDMGIQRRGKGSMFQGIKTSKKFVNSPIKEAEQDPEQEKIDSLRRSRQEKERGSERELGKDPKPSGQYYIMINGSTYKRDGEGVMFNSSIEAHKAIERIRAFRKSKGWGTARYEVIQQKGMEEALDPKAISTLRQAKQTIAKNREADLSSWEQDFRKNFALRYGSQPTSVAAQRPLTIPSSKLTPKSLEKHAVLKSRMGKLNAVIDKQKYLDYLTFKAEQKGLLNPRLEADIDTSLYVRDAEKDNYQSLDQKLDKSIELMKNRLGVNKLAFKKPNLMKESVESSIEDDIVLYENLKKWFKEKWVRFGPDGKIKGACARGDSSEGKPKCLPQSKAHSLGKKGRASAGARKRRQDPDADRSGKAINVVTKKKSNEGVAEGQMNEISQDTARSYAQKATQSKKDLINQTYRKGADTDKLNKKIQNRQQGLNRAHTDKRYYNNEQGVAEGELDEACWKGYHKEGNKKMFGKTYPNCVKNTNEEQEQLDEKCWDTHKQVGMKNKGGKQVPNCVPKESIEESRESCPECGGPMFSDMLLAEKKDACYNKVKSRYKVWPSAYASGALVQCRKKGAANWGTKSESTDIDVMEAELSEENLMAKEMFKRLELFKKSQDRQLGSKPKNRDIVTKEATIANSPLPKSYVEKAIYNVLSKQYPEVINRYGLPVVKDAVSNVADMHRDISNIEPEEAAIMLHQVIQQMQTHLHMRENKKYNS